MNWISVEISSNCKLYQDWKLSIICVTSFMDASKYLGSTWLSLCNRPESLPLPRRQQQPSRALRWKQQKSHKRHRYLQKYSDNRLGQSLIRHWVGYRLEPHFCKLTNWPLKLFLATKGVKCELQKKWLACWVQIINTLSMIHAQQQQPWHQF